MAIYMKLCDARGALLVKGTVKGRGRDGWIEVQSAQLPLSRATSQSSQSSAPLMTDITVTKQMDAVSPQIMRLAVSGAGIAMSAQLDYVADTTGARMLTVKLQDVLISSFSVSGGGTATGPTESFSLNYTKIEYLPG